MDDIDSALLGHLQRDARLTNRELARLVGIAPSTCLERVRNLRARGVITGYHAAVDPRALGRSLQALIFARLRPLSREVITSFQSYLSGLPEVRSVLVVSGDEDFVIHVAVPTIEHLHAFLMDRVSARREVVNFRSSVIYQQTVTHVLTPIEGPKPG
ncbi:winged helix-turn-helix transcriptional regulator [Streptomyces sp. 3MP-14]|uniref:Winged helix-turn-helix transcriptional regulator n=1 Tax=Streptomyces mimosae TaxID=2586635 RepID=A0A5N6AIT3_9ACTN|nr:MULTISPECIES: Lrp/AsnC family transcriptional regulator [Streptomyces]KAB8167780.1 winged helix-turn-helix transcriptional regulator [Streptomyces mimosae]KAB8177572.1 winged helix-turn-helix transcriptional regulator [Streptomyces sp. 3MP-14]